MNAVTTAPAAAPATGPFRTPFAWLVRREIWETKAVWIAPAICVAVLIVSSIVGGVQLGDMNFAASDPDTAEQIRSFGPQGIANLAGLMLLALAVPFFIVIQFTQFFYAMDALYSDRRDRSVLFFKSLPVSDAETVLSKVATACVVIPAVAFAATLLAQLLINLVLTVKFAGTGLPLVEYLWHPRSWAPAQLATLYGTIAVMLWSVPVVGWLLFVSAVATRSPFLWATLPPLGLALAERIAFGTKHVGQLLVERLAGAPFAAFRQIEQSGLVVRIGEAGHGAPPSVLKMMNPVGLVTDPGLWGGLFVGALFVAAAIWARRYRDETA
jgi:ABC-2 type transport system permease protein